MVAVLLATLALAAIMLLLLLITVLDKNEQLKIANDYNRKLEITLERAQREIIRLEYVIKNR